MSFPLDHSPARVVDMASGAPGACTYDQGGVQVAPLALGAAAGEDRSS